MEKIALDQIEMSSQELNDISQELWKNPELAFKETRAHDLLTAFLEKKGFQVQRQYILDTAFKASFGSDDGPQIAVMAEYDALPEIGHACGHNLIAESAVGAALGIKAALESMGLMRGRVIVLGTPAEEGGGGKAIMIRGWALEEVDVAMMVHPSTCWRSVAAPIKRGMIHQSIGTPEKLRIVHLSALNKVQVFGTPAEEGGAGKIFMIKGGAFVGPDVAMMVHPFNSDVVRPGMFARRKAIYTFHGKAAHAAMSPWMGENALDAAVQCYNSISSKRQQFRPDSRVHGIFTNGGAAPNIIPEEAELLYYIRSPNTEHLKDVVKKCESCAKGAALSADCTVDIKYKGYYAEVISNIQLANLYQKNCESLGMEFPTDEKITKGVGGSTDMGNVSYVVPSIHPMFGICTEAPNHSREFTKAAGSPEAQGPTLIQAKALALTAVQLLSPGGDKLLKAIKDEFAEVPSNPYATGEVSF